MTGNDAYERYRTYWKAANKEWLPDWKDITDRAKAAWDYIGSGAMQCDAADPSHQIIGSLRAEVVRLKSEMSRNYEASRNRESSVGKAITELTQQNSSLRAENRRIAMESHQRSLDAVKNASEAWRKQELYAAEKIEELRDALKKIESLKEENESLSSKLDSYRKPRKTQSMCRSGKRVEHVNFLSFDEVFRRVNGHIDEAVMLFENEDEKFRIAMIIETSPEIEVIPKRKYRNRMAMPA